MARAETDRTFAASPESHREPSSVRRLFERAGRGSRVRITGPRFCVWVSLSTLVAGLHVLFFHPAFRETWYAPLHFLWVVAVACGVSWWCLRGTALLQAGALVIVSCGVSWAVARVSWGGWIAGDARLPPAGGVLVVASVSLLAVSLLIALSGSAGESLRGGVFQEGGPGHRADRS